MTSGVRGRPNRVASSGSGKLYSSAAGGGAAVGAGTEGEARGFCGDDDGRRCSPGNGTPLPGGGTAAAQSIPSRRTKPYPGTRCWGPGGGSGGPPPPHAPPHALLRRPGVVLRPSPPTERSRPASAVLSRPPRADQGGCGPMLAEAAVICSPRVSFESQRHSVLRLLLVA